jgi:two-component system response regulator YesN
LINKDVPISIKKYKDDDNKSMRENAEKELSNAILGGDIDRVRKSLAHIMTYVRQNENQNAQQNFMVFLVLLPARLMSNMKTENMGIYANQSGLLMDFLQCADLNEQEDMLIALYEECTGHLIKMSNPHANTVVKRICETIEEQFMEQLSVASLSEMVNLTPAYLCVLFKQTTGKTINDYLTQVRLNNAKNLLAHSNIHLYDVCYKVGYFSPSYFSRIFKKYIGVTPREYRENIMLSSHAQEGNDEK